MFRQSPRRTQRSKGFKVKHVLQLCLLLGVGIWLLYQVKHSYDKKTSFQSNGSVSEKVKDGMDTIKLGRKDLLPKIEEEDTQEINHTDDENMLENRENLEDGAKESEESIENETKEAREEMESKNENEGDEGTENQDNENDGGKINDEEKEISAEDNEGMNDGNSGGDSEENEEEGEEKADRVQNTDEIQVDNSENNTKTEEIVINENDDREKVMNEVDSKENETEENEIKSGEKTGENEREEISREDEEKNLIEVKGTEEKEIKNDEEKNDEESDPSGGENKEQERNSIMDGSINSSTENSSGLANEIHQQAGETIVVTNEEHSGKEDFSNETILVSQNSAETENISLANSNLKEDLQNADQTASEDGINNDNNQNELTSDGTYDESSAKTTTKDDNPTGDSIQSQNEQIEKVDTNIEQSELNPLPITENFDTTNGDSKPSLDKEVADATVDGQNSDSSTESVTSESENTTENESSNSSELQNGDNGVQIEGKTTPDHDSNATDQDQNTSESSSSISVTLGGDASLGSETNDETNKQAEVDSSASSNLQDKKEATLPDSKLETSDNNSVAVA